MPENDGKTAPKLWLGIDHRWKPEFLAAFRSHVPADRLLELDGWTATWIPDEVFLVGSDPVTQVWDSIKPILDSIKGTLAEERGDIG